MTVNSDGLLNLNGHSDSFGPLVVNNGVNTNVNVAVGAGLVSFTALTMTGGVVDGMFGAYRAFRFQYEEHDTDPHGPTKRSTG